MTDAELATLKPGDRVYSSSGFPPGECVVRAVDRRTVYVRDPGWPSNYADEGLQAEDLLLVVASPETDDATLRSLESRWRALTDEVLVALRSLVMTRGYSLNALSVKFVANAEGANAGIWDFDGGGDAPEAPVAICSVAMMIYKEKP